MRAIREAILDLICPGGVFGDSLNHRMMTNACASKFICNATLTASIDERLLGLAMLRSTRLFLTTSRRAIHHRFGSARVVVRLLGLQKERH